MSMSSINSYTVPNKDSNMSSRSIMKTVGQKLQQYIDVERREEAFELSPSNIPKSTPVKARDAVKFGIGHDYRLCPSNAYLHYNKTQRNRRAESIKLDLQKWMTSRRQPPSKSEENLALNKYLIYHRDLNTSLNTSGRKTNRKSNCPLFNDHIKLSRRSPMPNISNLEKERLTAAASNLIIALENITLGYKAKGPTLSGHNEKHYIEYKKQRCHNHSHTSEIRKHPSPRKQKLSSNSNNKLKSKDQPISTQQSHLKNGKTKALVSSFETLQPMDLLPDAPKKNYFDIQRSKSSWQAEKILIKKVFRYELYIQIENRDVLPLLTVNLYGRDGSTGECTLFCPLQQMPVNEKIMASIKYIDKPRFSFLSPRTKSMSNHGHINFCFNNLLKALAIGLSEDSELKDCYIDRVIVKSLNENAPGITFNCQSYLKRTSNGIGLKLFRITESEKSGDTTNSPSVVRSYSSDQSSKISDDSRRTSLHGTDTGSDIDDTDQFPDMRDYAYDTETKNEYRKSEEHSEYRGMRLNENSALEVPTIGDTELSDDQVLPSVGERNGFENDNDRSVHSAIKNGNLPLLKKLLRGNPSALYDADAEGWIPLHLAVKYGQTNCVKWLAVNGADITQENSTGFTCMHLAVIYGHVHILQLCDALGCSIESSTIDQQSPLHLAAAHGKIECCRWLIANKANVNAIDSSGRSPLDLAEVSQQFEIAKLLRLYAKELNRADSAVFLLHSPSEPRSAMQGDGWISDMDSNIDSDSNQNADRSVMAQLSDIKKLSPQTDFVLQEKKHRYEVIKNKMQKQDSLFLDLIRNEIES
ncbi:Ankyrin repeat domain-containing protein 42 [Trichoplax sp. H2]|nr:Ankyrin repeat domain-containing protein 42 [Trichoplax sp. H2]|eukprot:RDD44369.1 Ankyrin repeat domain-containing protein 42 [Trichoplax sp. H2]